MRPPEEEIRLLVGEWLKKADLDFKTVIRSWQAKRRGFVNSHRRSEMR